MSADQRPRTILDKDDVLSGLFASWEALDSLLSGLTEEQWQVSTSLPGWTVHDVVAHIVGTEAMLSGEPTPDLGSRPDYVHNDIGALNEAWVEHLRPESPAAMMAKFREVTNRRKAALSALTPEEWEAITLTPVGPDSMGRFMRVRIFDCWVHEHDIRDAVGRTAAPGELSGPDTRLALDELAAGMGFVVGKKGRAPDGSRVLLRLTGPVAREIRVAVDGRATVVEDFDGADPTIVVTMDGLQFSRLAGGRPLISDLPQAVDYDGDVDAGRRIVENLSFVI